MKVAVLSIHPAPYRDPVFAAVHRRKNVELHVFTMFDTDRGHPYRGDVVAGYPHTPLGWGWRLLPHSYVHPGIVAALRRGGFDAVVVPGYNHGTSVLATLFCCMTGTPLIYSADTTSFVARPGWRTVLTRIILKKCGAVWVPGAASREYFSSLGFRSDLLFEGAYCLDAVRLAQVAARERACRDSIRAYLEVPEAGFVFLFAGRMIPERGLDYLVRAFARLVGQQPDAYMLLVGDGPLRPQVVANCRDLPRVRILDPVAFEQLAGYYAAADCYVLPCIREPYSLALAQAAISGLPLITTDKVGAAADYVRSAASGRVVGAGDSVALEGAMTELICDRPGAQAMGRAAQEVAMRRTVEWAADQFEQAAFAALSAPVEQPGLVEGGQ